MDFWKNILNSPTKIVAPMVDASELPWRLLSRRYGAQLCYTPMLHSAIFCKDPKYRKEALASCEEDKPLIIQFCGNDPKVMLEAALLAEHACSAIDINLGCPQAIAKRGHYGAYLQDEWSLLQEIVGTLSKSLSVPVTCKVRIFENLAKTVEYAKMLEEAGCKMLTVHGRTREQKGPLTGIADWKYVKAIRKAVQIPVISNGNIQNMQDIERCLEETGAAGVMTAEGNLYNPAIFCRSNPPAWEPAIEYLQLVERYPCPFSYIRGHLFKLFHHVLSLSGNNDLRVNLGAANNLTEFKRIVDVLREKYKSFHDGEMRWENTTEPGTTNLILPPWLCQPYIKTNPEEYLKNLEDKKKEEMNSPAPEKRHFEDADGNPITRKKMKKLRRINRRPIKSNAELTKRHIVKCFECENPVGQKCNFELCKKCCKNRCYLQNLDCAGHRILVKTRREMAQFYANQKNVERQHV